MSQDMGSSQGDDRLSCPICLSPFSGHRKPYIYCKEGHLLCERCVGDTRLRRCPSE